MAQLLRRQEARYHELMNIFDMQPVGDDIAEEVELQIKYEGYIQRQVRQVEKFKKFEKKLIPSSFDYNLVSGFSREVIEKLNRVRPETVGQASSISGVTPAAISLLLVAIDKSKRQTHRSVIKLS
jgi:tRNA uridine 5-carboxymethylaminomethyl modification enzyme